MGVKDRRDIVGVAVGSVVATAFLAAAALLYWHADGVFAKREAALDQAFASAVETADPETVDSALDGRLVHMTGDVRILSGATDPELGVAADALCLRRRPRYYQWIREKPQPHASADRAPGSYHYEKRWVDAPVDSGAWNTNRHTRNTTLVHLPALAAPANRAILGAYTLADELAVAAPGPQRLPLTPTSSQLAAIQSRFFPGATAKLVHAEQNELYFGADPRHPAIGDIRVEMYAVWPKKLSLIAVVAGNELRPFRAANGEELIVIKEGETSAARMLGTKTLLTSLTEWGMRAGLTAVCWLLLLFLRGVRGKAGKGAVGPALALAGAVMGCSWWQHRGLAHAGAVFVLMVIAGLAAWATSRREDAA